MLFVTLTMTAFYPLFVLAVLCATCMGSPLLPPAAGSRIAGIALASAGIVLMAWSYAVLHSFRLLAQLDCDHQMCTHGPYRFIRHPVYLGINLFYMGCFLLLPYPGFLLQAAANAVAYDLRARIEEEVMLRAFGDSYRRYLTQTYRLVPCLY